MTDQFNRNKEFKMIKILTILVLNLLVSIPTYAKAIEMGDVKFKVDTEALYKGDVHFALDLQTPDKFHNKYPDLYDLDSLAFMQEPNVQMIISKTTYIVNKPAGFFDHLNTSDERFVKHLLNGQEVRKITDHHFNVKVLGGFSHEYKIKTFFDSDDICTLPNSKVIRAVTQAKSLDVIAQSAASTTYRELTQFSKYFVGGIQVSTFIPLKENKTLVINYSLMAVKKYYALDKVLKRSLIIETEAQKNLINSYK
jgi:hypothetical protein